MRVSYYCIVNGQGWFWNGSGSFVSEYPDAKLYVREREAIETARRISQCAGLTILKPIHVYRDYGDADETRPYTFGA